jgi:hypothetical protein
VDKRAERAVWRRLAATPPRLPALFAPALLADLPEPAQRYFRFVIAPGTRLSAVSEVDRVQPFDGFLSEFRAFQGFMLPTRVEAGNFFGTRDYFPFYKARVRAIRFLQGEPKSP